MTDTPYYIISSHIDHQNMYEIHRSGEGRVAWSHHLLMTHNIVELLNRQEREKQTMNLAEQGEA